MEIWLHSIPSSVSDGGGVLFFALAHLLYERAASRAAWRHAQSERYLRARDALLRQGSTEAEIARLGPNVWQQALDRAQQRGQGFVGAFGAYCADRRVSCSVSQSAPHSESALAVMRASTWLFVFLTRHSSALPLRATCRTWVARLNRFRCCACGATGPPSAFLRCWHTYTVSGYYGACECRVCDSLLDFHLSCAACARLVRHLRSTR